jgi:hypothetical protein
MEPFPFPSLPADIRRELLKYSGTYGPISGLSRETLALTRSPYVLREICQRPISAKEITDLAEWFINAYGSLVLAQPLSTKVSPGQKWSHARIERIPRKDRYQLNQSNWLFDESGNPPEEPGMEYRTLEVNPLSPSLERGIIDLFNRGYTEIPLRLRYLIYNRRTPCVSIYPNYSVEETRKAVERAAGPIRFFQPLSDDWDNLIAYYTIGLTFSLIIPDEVGDEPSPMIIDWVNRNLQTLLTDPRSS